MSWERDVHPMSVMSTFTWPALPLEAWNDTRETVHRWSQIVGKIQLALTPMENHWWNVPLHVTPHGIGTSTMWGGDRWLDLELDFVDDVLRMRISDGTGWAVPLRARPVAELYAEVIENLRTTGIACAISPVPVEIENRIRFDRDVEHRAYDKRYVLACWQIFARTSAILERVRVLYLGKTSGVQLYWGHFDLALSMFSGRPAPPITADAIEREAYSHELIALGWWPGDGRFPKPAFYSYAAPEPAGFPTADIAIPHAYYHPPLRGWYLDYDDARRASDPDALIHDFFIATYTTAAALAGWDRDALERRLPDGTLHAPRLAG